MSFLRANRSIAGVVLEDFDSAFSNPFYQSHLDGPDQVTAQSIAAAAQLTASAVYLLAAGLHSAPLQASILQTLTIAVSNMSRLSSVLDGSLAAP